MADSKTYESKYYNTITPYEPMLRGISNKEWTNARGESGIGDVYGLTYDRNEIEKIFNQGTDAQAAYQEKQDKAAENAYQNNMFSGQQSAIETLRAGRNNQISSGMSKGLQMAAEIGTVLGLQQQNQAGALELANTRQTEADKIALAYAENVAKALEQSNKAKTDAANIDASLYNSDSLRYGSEVGANATMGAADITGQVGYDQSNIAAEAQKYAADKAAAAQIQAAQISAAASRSVSGTSDLENYTASYLESAKKYGWDVNTLAAAMYNDPAISAQFKGNFNYAKDFATGLLTGKLGSTASSNTNATSTSTPTQNANTLKSPSSGKIDFNSWNNTRGIK